VVLGSRNTEPVDEVVDDCLRGFHPAANSSVWPKPSNAKLSAACQHRSHTRPCPTRRLAPHHGAFSRNPVSGTAPVQSRVAKGLVNSCRWHGMQGVRGSNPLSSTTTTPQVTGLALLFSGVSCRFRIARFVPPACHSVLAVASLSGQCGLNQLVQGSRDGASRPAVTC